jgi:hypothetical protein
MANKDLFKQAIAEAKSVREAAIANAKEALEETLTPHLKDMLAAKLQEMEDSTVEEEVVNEVEEEVEEAKHSKKDDAMEEGSKEDDMDEAIEEELTEVPAVAEAEEDEAEDDSEESEDEAEDAIEEPAEEEGEDAIEGDEDLKDLSVDQFKEMIRDIIAQEVGGDAAADDMDAGDIEGMGDEEGMEEPAMEPEMGAEEDEIDLDELIRELESVTEGDKEDEMEEGKKDDDDTMEEGDKKKEMDEETSVQVNHESDGSDYNINRVADLKEALETIETLKSELNEVNILNAKLLYVNKIFKANNLTESQKVNVIAAFDKAETVKEVKLVFETVADNVGTRKETTIKEHKGSASKATGTTAKKPEVISEVSSAVLRMQKLAGIIK